GEPLDIPDRILALQRLGDALQPVGDFDRYRRKFDAARLLEVGELADLLPVQPDFPAQTPRAKRRAFPVVLDKADVVLARADAQRFERLEVKLLRVARIGLQNDLILEVILHPVRVFAVATVVRTHRWLDVSDAPRFGTEYAQQRRRVAGARADLNVIRL